MEQVKRARMESEPTSGLAEGQEEEVISIASIPNEILAQIFSHLSRDDLISVSKTSTRFAGASSDARLWWKLLHEDFSHFVVAKTFQPSTDMKNLYGRLVRSRVSAVGKSTPDTPVRLKKIKDLEKRKKKEEYYKLHDIEPFWILHLLNENIVTKQIAWIYLDDDSSYFGSVAVMNESQLLQVQAKATIWAKGVYDVVWRLKLNPDYTFGPAPVEFIIKQGDHSETWLWKLEDRGAINLDEWFDLKVGRILCDEERSKVVVQMKQDDSFWKYGLWIDYVEFVPVLPPSPQDIFKQNALTAEEQIDDTGLINNAIENTSLVTHQQ